ncbi:MAG: MarR family transcriptional regulator [Gammaproteobacteria bacterium]|nr:MarR family transcriptional regulator [Gammaproteobacteria bacterium]
MTLSQLLHIEQKIRRLARQLPELPATETLILRAAMILGRDFQNLLECQLKPLGLSEAEFRLLVGLRAHDGHASAGDLRAALAQSPANLTRLSDALVDRKLIRRKPDTEDRRRMLLTLEPAGEKLLQAMLPRVAPDVISAFAGFSAAEKKRLLASLKRLLAGIDALQRDSAATRSEDA